VRRVARGLESRAAGDHVNPLSHHRHSGLFKGVRVVENRQPDGRFNDSDPLDPVW